EDGPQQSSPVVIAYVVKPVRIEVDRIESDGEVVERRLDPDAIAIPSLKSANVTLHGRVIWRDDKAAERPKEVRIWLNDFQQLPVTLSDTTGPNGGEFTIRLVLNRKKDNLI